MTTTKLPLDSYRCAARSIEAKAAGALAVAAALLSPSAQATVHVFVPTSGNVADLNSEHTSVWVDLFAPGDKVGYARSEGVAGVFTLFSEDWGPDYGGLASGFLFPPQNGGADYFGFFAHADQAIHGYGYPDKLTGGATINDANFYHRQDSGPYISHPFYGTAPVWLNATGYVAVKFYNESKTDTYYGWLKLQTNEDATRITLLALGYNDTPRAGITAGEGLAAVPEPAASAALLALGAAGLVAYRRRKNLQRAAA